MEISVNSATCFKNNNSIFNDMNISLKNGEIAMITGPNGSGKTTLIRSLSGIQNLESGNILINNKDISDHNSNFTEKILYIGHKNSLNGDMTVIENLEYLGALDLSSKVNNGNKIKAALDYFDIYKYKDYLVSDLSEGNKKKTSLARIIMSEKKLWMLDEPLSFLDDKSSDILIKLILKNQEADGICIVSSHYDFSDKLNNVKHIKM
mgnify:FL=1